MGSGTLTVLLPHQMPERIKKVWRQSNYLLTGILLGIGGIVTGILAYFQRLQGPLIWLVGAWFVLTLGIFFVSQALIGYRYAFHRYEITGEDLAFQAGFIFRKTTYVPINRIQHVETEQGPFLRRENLMEIVVHTAATNHRLAGLDVTEALALREQIIQLVKVAKEDV